MVISIEVARHYHLQRGDVAIHAVEVYILADFSVDAELSNTCQVSHHFHRASWIARLISSWDRETPGEVDVLFNCLFNTDCCNISEELDSTR